MEVGTACLHEAFALETFGEREEVTVRQSQHTREGLERRAAAAMLDVEEVLERIVHQLPRTTGASP